MPSQGDHGLVNGLHIGLKIIIIFLDWAFRKKQHMFSQGYNSLISEDNIQESHGRCRRGCSQSDFRRVWLNGEGEDRAIDQQET